MDFAIARRRLVNSTLLRAGIEDRRILRAMGQIPRHWFVQEAFAAQAYGDNSLPIGFNQTISKPTVVARMLQGVQLDLQDRVLEVGTGSGYQTAILSRLVRRVFSVEIVPELIDRVRPVLAKLDCCNVSVRLGNGQLGCPEEAPFDKIVLSAFVGEIPRPLIAQLNPDGGRLVAPVRRGKEQRIRLLIRSGDQNHEVDLGPCVFVPMVDQRKAFHVTQDL